MKTGIMSLLLGLVLLTAALHGAWAEEPAVTARPPSAASVAARIDEAEQARRRAAELGAEWLATRDLIAQARKEAEQGNLQQAIELADLARAQGELAAAQAANEAEAWQQRVVR